MNGTRIGGRRCLGSDRWTLMLSAVLTTLAILLSCAKANASSFKHAEYLPFDGAKLYLQVRGADRTAPVLLWLHGGPGGAERPLFRYFNGGLERHFVVVYWDQRGAGRSFDAKADPDSANITQACRASTESRLNVLIDSLRSALLLPTTSWMMGG
jgi:pimeloyl-ACP methyl ester carboxylesterase